MPKVFVRQSTALFSIIVLVLLIISVGLLVAVLKGQIYHENLSTSTVSSSHRVGDSGVIVDITESTIKNVDIDEKPNDLNFTEVEDTTPNIVVQNASERDWEHFRLASYVIPIHYDLQLHPNLATDNFTGKVDIIVNTTTAVSHFVVHAYKLNIAESKVSDARGVQDIRVQRSFYYDPNEFFVVELENAVSPGTYKLSYQFSGTMNGSIVGLYKSRYSDHDTGQTRYLATSKFQPTYARRAFPCFDEPTFKSTFTVSLVHDAGYIALSNMPAEETKPHEEDLLITTFQKSVPMVTYLTCFIVCDFDYKTAKTNSGKEFRVYATRAGVNYSSHALEFGVKVLNYFERYFDLEYSLPKLDMIAIPDFVSGAMEHWGIITFRETNLLYNPQTSSFLNKQRISIVIAHEMAHMWFGNLVTMEWWDDLWLNEGFASFIEYKGVNEQYPQWDMMDQFVVEDLQPVFQLDSTMSSHPIVQPVSHPDEITEIFDDISYNKGASVLRMLEFFLGEENFRTGISRFLTKHQFKNAKTEDLWVELSATTNELIQTNISTIMSTWTKQMGFPYVTIVRESGNSSKFIAKQQRFVKDPEMHQKDDNDSDSYIWHVPLSYITSTGKTNIIWLHDKEEKTFEIPASEGEWVKFNVNQTGYYIINMEENEWKKFANLLNTNHTAMSPSDRSSLLHDAFLLSEAGLVNYETLLSLTKYLKKETHLIPWETAYASLVYLSQILEFTEVNSLMKRYINELTEPLYNKLGWTESSNHLDNLLQNTIIGLACHSGNKNCLKVSASLLQNWTQGQEISSTLKRLVYHYGMAEIGRDEHWNYMWDRYLVEKSPQERKILLYGLAHVRVPALIHRFLEYAMDESKIRRQDFFTVLHYLSGNPTARPFVWNFIRDKWKVLVDRFTLNDRYLGLVVKRICGYFTTENKLNQMQQFFLKYPDAGAGTRRRKQALENVKNNIRWLQKYKEKVKLWLFVESSSPWLNYRLPSHVIPLHYDLTLHPNVDNGDNFNGSVSINIKLEKECNHILLHSENLAIMKIEITRTKDLSFVPYQRYFLYEENSYLVIQFEDRLLTGNYDFHLEFTGNTSKDEKGMYKVVYTDPLLIQKKFVISSQLETTHARKMFPCFDEPTFKSTFNMHIIHSARLHALSNMIESESITLDDDLVETSFEKSVPMPTYLVCLVIGDLGYQELLTESKIRLRVYSMAHNVEKVTYALTVANRLLQFFENYLKLSYPLQKLDMIALPGISGGMENWGLITYGESNILIDNNSSSSEDKRHAVEIISHELAHMWFGNLVTMKWWDDIWLNEGFATFMESKGIQAIEPSWNFADDFVSGSLYRALKKDGTSNSRAILKTVNSASELAEVFDTISYSKGAAILKMLESLMGNKFIDGIASYLKKNMYKTVNTDDLWFELSLASSQTLDVKSLMATWTMQMNYPYISVKQNTTGSTILIQQHHFLETPEKKHFMTSPLGYQWSIPLTYRLSNESGIHSLMLYPSQEVLLDISGLEWVKFNTNFTGYYLVNYNVLQWRYFISLLKTNQTIFSSTDRGNFIYDSFALANAGHLSYDVPLNLSSYLIHETEKVPWVIAHKVFRELTTMVNNRTTKELIRHHMKTASENLYSKLLWSDVGDYNERTLRQLMIRIACENKNYKCLTQASKFLRDWMNGETMAADVRHLSYFFGMQSVRDEKTWMFMWNKYLNETSSREKEKLLEGLSNTRNRTLLKKLLKFSEDESMVMRDNYFKLLTDISKNPAGHFLVYDFILRNWTELVQRFTLKSFSLGQLVKKVCSPFNTEEKLKDVLNFFRKYPKAGVGQNARYQALEKIQNNIQWLEKHKDIIENWLNDNVHMPWKNIRLPLTVLPSAYNIYIHPDFFSKEFSGKTNITVNLTKTLDYIILHCDQLVITDTKVQNARTYQFVPITQAFPFELNHFWIIFLQRNISQGQYFLYFEFSGRIASNAEGLALASYTNNITNEERTLFYTQFEPIYARKMFPCFDEPSMKSRFRMTVVHHPNYTAISNMPEETITRREDGLLEVGFMESFPMSTYLVCIVISDYSFTETEISYGKKLRYFAPPDRLNHTLHTLNISREMLERFEEFYDIPYALPKLDFVAIPGFPMGGMENWGLVVLRGELLIDDNASLPAIIYSDKIVAHELAHQWFGNLVTMRWWDDIWLNEGFSTFAMYTALNHLYPDSQGLIAKRKSKVMMKDASQYSRPIVKEVRGRVEIVNMFDSISYEKGASVINMLQNVMKEDFKMGLSNYLKKYAYSNAETMDLWNELSMASDMDIDIAEVMDTWTLQMGFPYVEIEIHNEMFTAKQKRFVENYEADPSFDDSPYGYIWKIPLTYKNLNTGEEHNVWLNEPDAVFSHNISCNGCLKFNVNFTGYYIVKYDDKTWNFLSKRLQSHYKDFSETDRFNLVFDVTMLAQEGLLLYDVAFEISKYMRKEKSEYIWDHIMDFFNLINDQLRHNSDVHSLFKRYVLYLSEELYDDSCKNETAFEKSFLQNIHYIACFSENVKCVEEQRQKFENWLLDKDVKYDAALFNVIISNYGNETTWEKLWLQLNEENITTTEQSDLSIALSRFEDVNLIRRTLNEVIHHETLGAYSVFSILFQFTKNPVALPILWNSIKTYWEVFSEKLNARDRSAFSSLLANICREFSTESELIDMKATLKIHPEVFSIEDELSCFMLIEKNIEWANIHSETISNWLRWNVPS